MTIRLLHPGDVTAYRELRLFSLRESPAAFGSSYEAEVTLPPDQFVRRIRPHGDPCNGIYGAFAPAGALVGTLGFSRENRPKRAHIGTLWGMYVRPEARGHGLGGALLDRALDHARQLRLRKIILTVNAENEAAGKLYRSRGFACFGLEWEALYVAGRFFDEEHLVLHFPNEVSPSPG